MKTNFEQEIYNTIDESLFDDIIRYYDICKTKEEYFNILNIFKEQFDKFIEVCRLDEGVNEYYES